MAKDTEKLIRQLSLISFLMAERRPVSALEIKAGRGGLLADERRGLRAPLLRRPRRARVAGHRAEGRQAGRGLLRGGELLAAPGELLPARRSSSPTRSWAPCAWRSTCSTASSPTPSRCAWRSSSSRGESRRRWTLPRSARSRWRSRRAAAGASSRSGCRRSRRRSSAARRSCSSTTRSAATPRRSGRWTPTTCSSAAGSST